MTKIEWTDATWNPITGCSVTSPGCTNCYAMRLAGTRLRHHWSREGLTEDSKAGPVWTGKVRFNQEWLDQPLRWRRSRRIFVCAHGDLFHESVPDEWIDRVFAVMALAPQHTFQCLTKRSGRMMAYCTAADITQRIAKAIDAVQVDLDHSQDEEWRVVPGHEPYEASSHGRVRRNGEVLREQINPLYGRPSVTLWRANEPATVYVHKLVLLAHRGQPDEGEEAGHRNGDQADNRLANLRWVSRSQNQAEKVRHGSNGGPAKLTREQASKIRLERKSGVRQQVLADEYGVSRSLISMIETGAVWPDALAWPLPNVWLGVSVEDQARADERIPDLLATPAAVRFLSCEPLLGAVDLRAVQWGHSNALNRLDWVIAGGESGPGARPMHPDWARSLRDQCQAAGVPFFFKQWGEWGHAFHLDGCFGVSAALTGTGHWPEPKRYRVQGGPFDGATAESHPDDHLMLRIGKARAGRLLDGREWSEFPA